MARMVESTTSYTLQVRTNEDSLGKLLGEAKSDKMRIMMDVLIRAAISALAIWVWSRQGGGFGVVDLICYAGLAVFTAYPLLHCSDHLFFYENGIMFRKKTYLFRSQQVQWICREGVGYFLQGRYLKLDEYKQLNVSYVRKALDKLAKAYDGID